MWKYVCSPFSCIMHLEGCVHFITAEQIILKLTALRQTFISPFWGSIYIQWYIYCLVKGNEVLVHITWMNLKITYFTILSILISRKGKLIQWQISDCLGSWEGLQTGKKLSDHGYVHYLNGDDGFVCVHIKASKYTILLPVNFTSVKLLSHC